MAIGNTTSSTEDLAERIAALEAENARLVQENTRLSHELKILLNRLFRAKSEKLDPNQLMLFLDEAASESEPPPEPEVEEPAPKKKRGHGRRPFRKDMPRIVEQLEIDEKDRCCDECGEDLKRIGEDITERGHVIPARMVVKRWVRGKWACPKGHGMKVAPLPDSLIEKAKYEPSVYAHVAASKYCDHLPLNRLEGIYRRNGIDLSRQTMWEMMKRLDEVVVQPILAQMHKEILKEKFLQADETPVLVQMELKQGAKKGYIWGYGRHIKRMYDFTLTRERDGPKAFLRNWKGILQTDGYSGYDEVVQKNELIRVGCWAHARRHFKEALDTGTTDAARVLLPIQKLFHVEALVAARIAERELDEAQALELRARVRRRTSHRVLARIESEAEALRRRPSTMPKSLLGKALRYLERQWEPLTQFLTFPEVPLHNNDAERQLRHLAVGRKNWCFFGSKTGAEVGARIASLMLACKSLDIDPERYLTEVIELVNTTPTSQIASLTPWAMAESLRPAAETTTAS